VAPLLDTRTQAPTDACTSPIFTSPDFSPVESTHAAEYEMLVKLQNEFLAEIPSSDSSVEWKPTVSIPYEYDANGKILPRTGKAPYGYVNELGENVFDFNTYEDSFTSDEDVDSLDSPTTPRMANLGGISSVESDCVNLGGI
jgi:hypothetical protein